MLTRRQFLSALGVGATAPIWSSSAWADSRKRVIVVGGGLSGLTAAWRLARSGVEVEVIEAQERLGGRFASSFVEDASGERLSLVKASMVVPGHATESLAFFKSCGVLDGLEVQDTDPFFAFEGRVIDPNGAIGRLSVLREVWARARAMGERWVPFGLGAGERWLERSSVEQIENQIGLRSVLEWHRQDSPLTPWKALEDLMAPLIFNADCSELDAASYVMAERYYRLGHKKDPSYYRASGSPQDHIWERIRAHLEGLGVQFRLGVEVSEMRVVNGQVAGLVLGSFSPGAWTSEAPIGWTEVERAEGGTVYLHRSDEGRLRAFPRRELVAEEELYVVEAADGIHVEGEDNRQHLQADRVILACGAESAWALAGDLLQMKPPLMRERVCAQFWMDRPFSEKAPSWFLADGSFPVSAVAMSRLELESGEWAGGSRSVVALECPASKGQSDEELLESLLKEVRILWPELLEAHVLERRLSRWSQPVPGPGWRKEGPELSGAFPGLFVAGEHMPQSEGQQGVECAVMSGQSAALAALEELEMVID